MLQSIKDYEMEILKWSVSELYMIYSTQILFITEQGLYSSDICEHLKQQKQLRVGPRLPGRPQNPDLFHIIGFYIISLIAK